MNVHFYLESDLTPETCDYEMEKSGLLVPVTLPEEQNPNLMVIVLERGGATPSDEQRETIRRIRTAHPAWKMKFFYLQEGTKHGTGRRVKH